MAETVKFRVRYFEEINPLLSAMMRRFDTGVQKVLREREAIAKATLSEGASPEKAAESVRRAFEEAGALDVTVEEISG